jgi:hypothetical protein
MLKQRHRHDELTDEHPVVDEAGIRADERRRVLAELAERDGRHDDHAVDWRDAPPPFGEARVDDPADTAVTTAPADPRRWDGPDDRWDDDQRDAAVERTTPARTVVADDTVTERGASPGQLLVVLAGAASLALGIAAVVRTGLDGPLSEPTTTVLWWDHTALLGLIEIGAGALMLLSGLRAGARWIGGLVGLAAIVGGALILGELDWTVDRLGAERDFGWVAIGIGAAAVIGAAIPRVRRTRHVERTRSMLA